MKKKYRTLIRVNKFKQNKRTTNAKPFFFLDVIYVDDTPTYYDHYPSPYYPSYHDLHPRQYKRYRADPATTQAPTTKPMPPPTTTEEPTYICAVCKKKCGV